jgi:hypothetical protein
MKSYTDIEQSKKLAEILPIESADYTHLGKDEDNVLTRPYFESCSSELKEWIGKDEMYPCWSFTALFKLLPKSARLEKGNVTELYRVILPVELETSDWYIDPVDACVVMIERLYELNLLRL